MGVKLLEEFEEEVPARLRLVSPARDIEAEIEAARAAGYEQASRELTAEYNHRLSQRMPRAPLAAEMLPVMERLAMILGIRAMLALALVGTFIMAWRAMSEPDVSRIAILALFGAIALGPLAWLASRKTG